MNILLPITAIAAAFFVTRNKSKSIPSSSSIQPYISEDSTKACFDKNTTLPYSIESETVKNSKLYDKLFSKLSPPTKENGFNLKEVANQSLKIQFKNFNPKQGIVSVLDTPTLKWLYVNQVMSSAFYLAKSGKVIDLELAFWLNNEFATELISLNLLVPGKFYSIELMNLNKSLFENKESLTNLISKMLILLPQLKEVKAELLATFMMIGFSQITHVEIKNNCMSVTDFQYGDFTSLSGKIDPYFQKLYNLFYNSFIEATSI